MKMYGDMNTLDLQKKILFVAIFTYVKRFSFSVGFLFHQDIMKRLKIHLFKKLSSPVRKIIEQTDSHINSLYYVDVN